MLIGCTTVLALPTFMLCQARTAMTRRPWRTWAIALLSITLPAVAMAQAYPSRSVRVLVGVPPGGTNDVVARLVSQKLSAQLGQQFVVENRGGAGGNIAGEIVAKSPPDGYTIYMASVGAIAINPSFYPNMPYDTLRDLAPISQLTSVPQLLVVHPSVPANDVKQLIAYARAKPGQLNFASGSSGSAIHLAGEMFKTMAGLSMVHIPYKGSNPAMLDLLAGRVSLMFDQIVTSLPLVQQGKLRALGVTTLQRSPIAPDIPTIAEAGLPGYEISTWHGLFAPGATPRDIVNRLSSEAAKALQSKDIHEKYLALGADPVSSTPEQFAAYLKSDIAKWAKVIKDSGAKLD